MRTRSFGAALAAFAALLFAADAVTDESSMLIEFEKRMEVGGVRAVCDPSQFSGRAANDFISDLLLRGWTTAASTLVEACAQIATEKDDDVWNAVKAGVQNSLRTLRKSLSKIESDVRRLDAANSRDEKPIAPAFEHAQSLTLYLLALNLHINWTPLLA